MSHTGSSEKPRAAVVVAAAGRGERLGDGANKVLLPLNGSPIIAHTLRIFQDHPAIGRICLVTREAELEAMAAALGNHGRWDKLLPLVAGGRERQDSVANGLATLERDPPRWVLVHDGARPLCSPGLLERVLNALADHRAVVPGLPIHDTVRRKSGKNAGVVEREELLRCQTPQGFHWEVLAGAHRHARAEKLWGTDEAQLVEAVGEPLFFVEGEARNLKITTPQDLALAEWLALTPGWGAAKTPAQP